MEGRVWQGGGETRVERRSVNMSWGVLVTKLYSVFEVLLTVVCLLLLCCMCIGGWWRSDCYPATTGLIVAGWCSYQAREEHSRDNTTQHTLHNNNNTTIHNNNNTTTSTTTIQPQL